MTKVVGVRFRNVGKIYYFSPKDYEIKTGDHVIVETARGIEYGKVVLAPREVGEEDVVHPLKEVLRVATKEDDEREAQNRVREREAFKICQKKIREHGLEMKLIDAEYTFDNNKVLFYFTADGRIDFRQLVKDLAAIFKTRIELRQIGVRDETKILGGIGICGRCLCCHTYLSEFAPVSIKMAKEQNLSLNPTKISGVCGRLMCCLKGLEFIVRHVDYLSFCTNSIIFIYKKSRSLRSQDSAPGKKILTCFGALPARTHSSGGGQSTAVRPEFCPVCVHSPTTEVCMKQVFPNQRHRGALLSPNFPLGWWIGWLHYIPIYPDCQ